MGKRGPAKQPQQLLDLKGYSTPSRERAEVAMVGEKIADISQVPDMCDFDKLTPRGQRILLRQCSFLIHLKVLQANDLDDLVLYAQNYDMALRCMRSINKEGWHVKVFDKDGNFKGYAENPNIKLFDKVCKTINSIGTQYGFTPASRIRLSEEKQPEKKDIMDIATDAIEI